MLFATTGTEERRLDPILTAQSYGDAAPRAPPVPDKASKPFCSSPAGAPGPDASEEMNRLIAQNGTRASQALMLAVRAKALIDGRLQPSVDDVIALPNLC